MQIGPNGEPINKGITSNDGPFPIRNRPAHGVFISRQSPTLVFLTVCSEQRRPWLANDRVHQLLRESWTAADAWLVGRYVIMPDHVHLFCAPSKTEFTLDNWVKYWKRLFSLHAKNEEWAWQPGHWDRRLRTAESYEEKWSYVLANPVRKGLVSNAAAWPFQGVINTLRW